MHENRETSETPAVQPGSRSAGEGSGHTARMHVCEESHCGIVPMNHSNKDGILLAESEEGRLRIKESAGQSNTCPTQSGEACVSQGLSGVRTSGSLGRYSSEIRTGCANERPSGSVRGAPGDWCPYRDRQPRQVPVFRGADLHRANLARGPAEVGQARPFTIRFGDGRPELTIDISLRPRSSLRRSKRAREDRLR